MAFLQPQPGVIYREQVSRLISWGHWFTFFNILLALVISSRYILANPWPSTQLGVAYLFLSWIGHFSFAGFITYLVTLFPLSFILPNQKVMRNCSVIIAVLVLTALLLDTQIYHVFKFHINSTVWDLLLKEAQSKSELNWNFLFVVIPILFLLELIISNYTWKMQLRRRNKKRILGDMISATLVSCFLLTHLSYLVADAKLYEPIISQRSNFPLSYPMTARTFLARHGWLDIEQYRSKAAQFAAEEHVKYRLIYPQKPLHVIPPEEKKNILFIVVSGLREDMVQPDIMPFLSAYADNNQQFRQHISGDNDHTASTFSLFYGVPDAYHSNFDVEGVSPIFLDELQRQDYILNAFSSYGLNSDIYKKSVFHAVRPITRKKTDLSEQSDSITLKQWHDWFAKQKYDRQWFSYLNFSIPSTLALPSDFKGPFQPEFDSNSPFSAFTAENKEKLLNRYKNALRYTDEQLQSVLASLQESQEEENTIVVITSDHGMEFNETNSNNWGFGSNYSEFQMRVPLIIGWPGKTPQKWDKLTTHYDIVPTLMSEVLGVTNDTHDYSSGLDLFSDQVHNWVLLGNRQRYVVYDPKSVIQFNRQGEFNIFTRKNYQLLEDARPDMGVLLQVMKELTRFKDES